MMTSEQIRASFIDFFKKKNHAYVQSSPVVPVGDDTLLFTNAGMNQFKDVFLGLSNRDYTRAANSQKCIRAGGKHNDLEEVGRDTYHHTFFEMLGNWSFGDYFKKEAIEWAWELLVKEWGLDAGRMYATYFEGDKKLGIEPDNEAKEIWLNYLPAERVLPGNVKDNFWEMGDTGPCGPCSEIHYDGRSDELRKKQPGQTRVNQDDPDVIEIWNLVFIQYNRDAKGLSPLPAQHVDTGMGFERIVRCLQGKTSNYDTDVFGPIFKTIKEVTGAADYTSQMDHKPDIAYRVLADHARTLTFAITDGAVPSNEGRGYVLRRILRRAARFGLELDMHEPFIYKIVPTLVEHMSSIFPEIAQRQDYVAEVIKSEEQSFCRTLERGVDIFEKNVKQVMDNGGKILPGEDAFRLYDTYGFPLDLTQLMAREKGFDVDVAQFEELMQQQRQRARAGQKTASYMSGLSGISLPVTDDSAKYETDSCITHVVGWIDQDGLTEKGSLKDSDKTVGLILKETCFYAESGGQVGDGGMITADNGKFVVETTDKIADCVIHKGKLECGTITVGDKIKATVDKNRESSRKNHTATHLLQWALQQVLGDSVKQQGSLVSPEYLRFDFTYPKALTDQEIKRVEHLVMEKIHDDFPVACSVMPLEEAQKLGAMALFSEKYGQEVRVVAIGTENGTILDDAFSMEFCGGTHVTHTGRIGGFKVIREESVSAGVRRITALTGLGLTDYLIQRSEVIDDLTDLLKTPPEQITTRVKKLLEDNKKLTKQLKTGGGGGGDILKETARLLDECETIDGSAVIVSQIPAAPVQQVRTAIDSLKKKAKSAVIVFGMAEDQQKAMLLAAVTDDLVKKGIKAGDIVKEIAPLVNGGGGGRPQMAQAGGKAPDKIPQAMEKALELIKQKLSA